MKYIEFDESRPMDLVLLGRVAIDFNPAYNDQVKEEFKPLKKVHMFEKFVGGSPANIAVGVTKHGLKAGFIGKVSDDQFGEYVVDYFDERGIDTSQITKCTNGEKLGLTFTEMLSPKESSILMYRNRIADLQLHVDDIHEDYIKNAKAILISGTALAESPSREAAIKAVEAVDKCVGDAVEAIKEVNGQMFICADHGNCEQLIDYETGEPFTAHTTNPVPFILVNADPSYKLREGGVLADIVPTLIELMGMEQPAEMTGKSLLIKK